jgi:hypothetical protein
VACARIDAVGGELNMSETRVKRYPVRGALYGLLVGLAAAYFAFFQFAMFGFDNLPSVITKFAIIVLAGVVLGIVWAFVAPAKGAKAPANDGPAPAAPPAVVAAPPVATTAPPVAMAPPPDDESE